MAQLRKELARLRIAQGEAAADGDGGAEGPGIWAAPPMAPPLGIPWPVTGAGCTTGGAAPGTAPVGAASLDDLARWASLAPAPAAAASAEGRRVMRRHQPEGAHGAGADRGMSPRRGT